MNYLVEKDRKQILDILLTGLSRLEYRGYDSAGLAIDGDTETEVLIYKQVGKVNALRTKINETLADQSKTFIAHTGLALLYSRNGSYQMGYPWATFCGKLSSTPIRPSKYVPRSPQWNNNQLQGAETGFGKQGICV